MSAFLIAFALAAPAAAQLALRFEPEAVVATGMTAGGEVAWLGVARVPLGSFQRVEIHREGTRADAAGEAVIELPEGVPGRSVWAAVDLSGGEYAVGAPPGYPLREARFAPDAFGPGTGGGGAARIRHLHRRVVVLVARPGAERPGGEAVRAWTLSAADGGTGDGDGRRDGALETVLGRLVAVAGAGEAPPALLPGDVVVVLDPERMNVTAARLAPAEGGG